ncbi:MAG: hypothetical protein C0501_23825 [Isosphaera sp.]|nr:hypothetical protein [Isosphaera sp.]
MNDALRAVAEDLLEYLLWMANDALAMQKIPTCDPNTDENCGPDAQVRTLQAFYQPHERLPEPGQAIYRELQGMIDLRLCDPRTGTHTPVDELVRFHKTIDRMLLWLVEQYQLAQPVPEVGPQRKPGNRGPRPDPEFDRGQLLQLIVRRHGGGGPEATTPYTQEELAKELGWNQSRVSRRMAVMFTGGMAGYRAICVDGNRFGGILNRLRDGSFQADGVDNDSDDEE